MAVCAEARAGCGLGAGLGACESGTAILEFAILLPVLVALGVGCVEFGRAMFIRSAIEQAVRGGARLLAQVPDPTCAPLCSRGATDAIALARDEILANTGLGPDAVMVRPVPGARPGTVILRAEVKVGFSLLPLLGLAPALTLTVSHQEQAIEA